MASTQLILLTGATGYIGGRLLKELEARGRRVRCLARHPEFLRPRLAATTELVQGDAFEPATLEHALEGVDTAYYLVHSMHGGAGFREKDRQAAQNFGQAGGIQHVPGGKFSAGRDARAQELRLPSQASDAPAPRLQFLKQATTDVAGGASEQNQFG